MISKTPFDLCEISQSFHSTHIFYSSKSQNVLNAEIIQNGNGFLICCDEQNTKIVNKNLNKSYIQGESFCFDGNIADITKILKKLNAKIITTENFENLKIIYAYSYKLQKFIFVDGKKVNVQICLNENKITVGTPLILGSY